MTILFLAWVDRDNGDMERDWGNGEYENDQT